MSINKLGRLGTHETPSQLHSILFARLMWWNQSTGDTMGSNVHSAEGKAKQVAHTIDKRLS